MDLEITINGVPYETSKGIILQTFNGTNIPNYQKTMLIQSDENFAKLSEHKYDTKFRPDHPTAMYNCHGLTFACRRTGIFDDHVVESILKEEYREIKERKDVQSGDIVVYRDTGVILHSALVVYIETMPHNIKVLSKDVKYKEIEHYVDRSPFNHGEKKFYRINHAVTKIIS